MSGTERKPVLYAFVCGVELTRFAFVDPFDQRAAETIESPDFLYVIDHREGLVLVDSGVHPATAARLGDAIRWSEADSVLAKLHSLGADARDVRYVVQTHLHYDHAGGLPLLEGVPVVVQEDELRFARSPPVYQRDFFHRPDLEAETDWMTVTGEVDLFGDGTVRLIPTPGHTAGHQCVLVDLAGGPVLLAGDLHYSLEKMAERRLPAVVWNPDAMVAGWIRAEGLARECRAKIMISHELAYRETMRLGPAEYYA